MAAGLLEAKKEASLAASDDNVIGPSMPEPEPVHTEVQNTPPYLSALALIKGFKLFCIQNACTIQLVD